jgi:hypothetical protein
MLWHVTERDNLPMASIVINDFLLVARLAFCCIEHYAGFAHRFDAKFRRAVANERIKVPQVCQ